MKRINLFATLFIIFPYVGNVLKVELPTYNSFLSSELNGLDNLSYDPVNLQNKTSFTVTGEIIYADGGKIGLDLCKNDKFSLQPGETKKFSRGSCLIKKIEGQFTYTGAICKSAKFTKIFDLANCAKPMVTTLTYTLNNYTSSGTGFSQFDIVKEGDDYKIVRTDSGTFLSWSQNRINNASALTNSAAKSSARIANDISNNAEIMAKAGLKTTSKEFKDLSKEAEQQLKSGLETVASVAGEAYEWLDENACNLALTVVISAGVVAYFTPKPAPADPGTLNSVALSGAYATASTTGKLATEAGKIVLAKTMSTTIVEGFLLIPGIEGNVDEDMLKNVIGNSISASLDCPACWGTPAGVGVAIGGAVAPIVAQMVCRSVIPKGYAEPL